MIKINTYIINLKRSPERWQSIHNHLTALNIAHERVDAVDARLLKFPASSYNKQINNKVYFLPLKDAEVACYLSHVAALRQFVENESITHAVVLEDDVEFQIGMEASLLEIACQIDAMSAQVVKLYSKRPVWCRNVLKVGKVTLGRPVRVPLGFQAQLWTRPAAIEFIKHAENFFQPVDVDLQFKWWFNFDVRLIQPNVVRELSAELGGSTISPYKNPLTWSKVRLEVMRPWFRLKLLARSLYCTFL